MTTQQAAIEYLRQHQWENRDKKAVVYNPKEISPELLPVIYAFLNSKNDGHGEALAIAEDGHCLGSHYCSQEAYVPNDLGVLEGTRPDRHETYKEHYPNGYRMQFVRISEVLGHAGIETASQLNKKLQEASEVKVES